MKRAARTLVPLAALILLAAAQAGAEPSGNLTWGRRVTLATQWLHKIRRRPDPGSRPS